MKTFRCSCGKEHPIDRIEIAFIRPDEVVRLAFHERGRRCVEADEWVMLDNRRIFLRGLLPLPVRDRVRPYSLGVWAEISLDTFLKIAPANNIVDPSRVPPFDGLLANNVPGLPEACGLPLDIQLTGIETRPVFRLTLGSHPLIDEQFQGITSHRAFEYSMIGGVAEQNDQATG